MYTRVCLSVKSLQLTPRISPTASSQPCSLGSDVFFVVVFLSRNPVSIILFGCAEQIFEDLIFNDKFLHQRIL